MIAYRNIHSKKVIQVDEKAEPARVKILDASNRYQRVAVPVDDAEAPKAKAKK